MGGETAATKKESNVLLLKTDMGSGHFGPSGRYEGIKETAFDYAFLADRLYAFNDNSVRFTTAFVSGTLYLFFASGCAPSTDASPA